MGVYTTAQNVSISTNTTGATIRYTTDGSTPGETAGTIYSTPVSITATGKLQAIAYETGYTDSTIACGDYSICNLLGWWMFDNSVNDSSGNGNIQCAIYTDNNGKPGTLLKGTNTLSNPGTGWVTFTLTSGTNLYSTNYYWLMFWSAANYSVKNNPSSGTSWYTSLIYSSWPSSLGAGVTETRTWSIYAF